MNNYHIFFLSPIVLSILQLVSCIEVQVDVYCAMNNHHISYSLSNRSLYTQGVSYIEVQVDCVLRYELRLSLFDSLIILSILQKVSC